jgi:hypothetical protein
MLALLETGRRVGVYCRQKDSQAEYGNLGIIEGAMFALFGLVIAFTFSGAVSRFNEKRMLIAEEVNGIETAYLRLNLISQDAQPGLRQLFRQYVDSRAETYRRLPNMEAADVRAIGASLLPRSHPDAARLLLPALNNMIDIATKRTMSLRIHPPGIIYALLLGLSLICSLLAGYRMSFGQRRSWLHILSFAFMTVITVYVILDIEYPRAGLIRMEAPDQLLLNIRDRMR